MTTNRLQRNARTRGAQQPAKRRTSRDDIRVGIIGTVLLVTVVVAAMRFEHLPVVGASSLYYAEFAEAAGLKSGNEVIVAGAAIGRVKELELDGDRVRVGFTLNDGNLRLGDRSEARIVTVTLLGEAALELVPAGSGRLPSGRAIPLERTSSPYNITSALADLTTEVQEIDVDKVAQTLSTVSDTFRKTPDDVRSALVGVDKVARAVGDNDQTLQSLLGRASNVTGVLASRNAEIGRLLVSGESLLKELNARQDVVIGLLRGTRSLTAQLRAVVRENNTALRPALRELTTLTRQLNRNKKNLEAAIAGARNYAIGFGEAVSTGPFFDAYVQNLTAPGSLAPIVSGLLP
jgi:phospholipid/cholesterol/gamma-HCH transport system substrate-binding protein